MLGTVSAPGWGRWQACFSQGSNCFGVLCKLLHLVATEVVSQATQAGLYTVVVSPPGGCPSRPATARVVTAVTPKGTDAGLQLAVYPEPAAGAPRTALVSGSRGPVTLTLRNALGQLVWQAQVMAGPAPRPVPLPARTAGMYILVAEAANGRVARRLSE